MTAASLSRMQNSLHYIYRLSILCCIIMVEALDQKGHPGAASAVTAILAI
jgi:hypothetical protein